MAYDRKKNNVVYGIAQALYGAAPNPIVATRRPTNADRAQIGTIWISKPTDDAYCLTSVVANVSTWINIGGAAGVFDTVTATTTINAGTTITAGTGFTCTAFGRGMVRSSAAGVFSSINGTNGQTLIATTGGDPAWGSIVSGDGSLNVILGAGSIDIRNPGATAAQFTVTGGGVVVPLAGNTNVIGYDANITTDGATANTIKVRLSDNVQTVGSLTAGVDFGVLSGFAAINADANMAAAIDFAAVGGVNATITIRNTLGTNAGSIAISSTAGGITNNAGTSYTIDSVTGLELNCTTGAIQIGQDANNQNINIGTGGARTVTIGNAGAGTGLALNAGTGHITATTTGAADFLVVCGRNVALDSVGTLELNSSAGIIGIGNDAVAQNINIGTGAAARTITVGNGTGATSLVFDCGTGALNIGTNGIAHTVTIGNITGATAVNVNTGTGGSTYTTTNGTLAFVTGTGAINIGADAAAKTITIGNVTGATAVNVNSGSGACAWTTTNGTFGLVTGTGAINLGADAVAKIVTIGNITGATAVNLNAGSGGITLTTTNSTFAIVTGTGAINIGTTAVAKTITVGNATGATSVVVNVGTGNLDLGVTATAHATRLGSTNGASATTIQSGTGGVTVTSGGLFDINPATDVQASPSAASTLNVDAMVVTFTGFTTAATATQRFTITDNRVAATSGILCSVSTLGANDARLVVQRIIPGAGSFTVDVINDGTQAVNGNVIVSCFIMN